LAPLHGSAIEASRNDPALGERLTLVDALRIGGQRLRGVAAELLRPRLDPSQREHRAVGDEARHCGSPADGRRRRRSRGDNASRVSRVRGQGPSAQRFRGPREQSDLPLAPCRVALILDAMPALAEIVGFDNRWQAAAVPHAVERILPSGAGIRASVPPYLVAMNWRPFRGRGRGDFIDSRDFEDISVLLDRRNELVDELAEAGDDVRGYVAAEASQLLDEPRLLDGFAAALATDAASQRRAGDVILPALRSIAEL
jgi:hypothetical protein